MRAAAVALLMCSAGCSFIFNWDPNGLACEPGRNACLPDYSCNLSDAQKPVCVADNSLKAGDACSSDRQCPEGHICPRYDAGNGLQHCARSCSPQDAYTQLGCPANQYCKPYLSVAAFSDVVAHEPQLVAACVPSDGCTAGNLCNLSDVQGGICTPVQTLSACVVSCELTISPSGPYADNCGRVLGRYDTYCTPIGNNVAAGSQPAEAFLACLPIVGTPVEHGAACNGVAEPCQKGEACVNGFCRSFCQAPGQGVSNCANGETCCAFSQIPANNLQCSENTCGYCSPQTVPCGGGRQ
jgi:hypothetical protein